MTDDAMNEKQEALPKTIGIIRDKYTSNLRVRVRGLDDYGIVLYDKRERSPSVRPALTPSPVTPENEGRNVMCEACQGSGENTNPLNDPGACQQCDGHGYFAPVTPDASGLPEEIWCHAVCGRIFVQTTGNKERLTKYTRTPSSLAELEAEVESWKEAAEIASEIYAGKDKKIKALQAQNETLVRKLDAANAHIARQEQLCKMLTETQIVKETERYRKALDQLMDDLSGGTMVFPGHGVCEQAWNEAIEALTDKEESGNG